MNGIRADRVSKSYGGVQALRELSLDVRPGELFGLIGPDGSGKTTLFRILTTLLLPDSGDATLCGLDVKADIGKIRSIAGYMPGRFSLYQDLSVEENLHFFATVFGTTIKENYDLIRDIYIQLEPFRKRRAGKLSGGMKQKLALCCALIHKPAVLLLDEPTTGVDPVSRVEFWDMLARLKEQGITILVSTPYMDEASRCDRIAFMREGNIFRTDTPEGIRKSYEKTLWAVRSESMYKLLLDLRQYELTASCFSFGSKVHLTLDPRISTKDEEQFIKDELYGYLRTKGHAGLSIERIRPDIEDCFMALSGGRER
jgi:ABC-type multidrug transport system ATPase subunit